MAMSTMIKSLEDIMRKDAGLNGDRSIFRNEGDFDRNLEFRIIPAVWNGLTV